MALMADKKIKKINLKKLLRVWFAIAKIAVQDQMISSLSGYLFLVGKIFRFLFLFVFLFSVLSATKTLSGYTREQVIVFFLVFYLVDTMSQSLFRGVYWFRALIVSGDYDFDLLKPMPSFFRPVFGWTDIFDLITLFFLLGYFAWFAVTRGLVSGLESVFLFTLLFVNSLVISFGIHLFVCAVGVLTTEIDHLIMVYRDVSNMARFPTDIYPQGIRLILTFVIPVVVLITVPAKSILGLLSLPWVIISVLLAGTFLYSSLRFWKYALAKYSSASS